MVESATLRGIRPRLTARRSVLAAVLMTICGSSAFAASPEVVTVNRRSGSPGEKFTLTVTGKGLANQPRLWASFSEVQPPAAAPADNGKQDGACVFDVTIPAQTPIGLHVVRVLTEQGLSLPIPFLVDDLPVVARAGGNQTFAQAQTLTLPAAVSGSVENLTRDYYRFSAAAGQTISLEAYARRIGSPIDCSIYLYDSRGRILAYNDDAEGLSSDPQLAYTFSRAGDYVIELRDIRYQGGPQYAYYLRIGDFPCIHSAFPLAVRKGTTARIDFAGVSCTDAAPATVTVPADWQQDWYPVSTRRAGGRSSAFTSVFVTTDDEVVDREPNNNGPQAQESPLGPSISGRFDSPGDVDQFRFHARKGERWLFTGATREIGTPADLTFRLLQADGKSIATADDSGTSEGTLDVTFPTDGLYILELVDLNKRGGPQYSYRVTPWRHRPGFALSASTDTLNIPLGGTVSFTVSTVRRDYGGPIELSLDGLPPGLTGGRAYLGAGVNSATMTVSASREAAITRLPMLRVIGRATGSTGGDPTVASLNDSLRARWNNPTQVMPALTPGIAAAVVPPQPISIRLEPSEVVIGRHLSSQVRVVVERTAGFDAAIKLTGNPEKDGLPPNVAVELKPIEAGKNEVILNISGTEKAVAGPYSVVLNGIHEKDKVSTAVTAPNLVIRMEEPFQLVATPTASPQLAKGQSLKFRIAIQRNPAFTGEVKLSCGKLPAGVMAPDVIVKADQSEADVVLTAASDAAAVATTEVQLQAAAAADPKIQSSISLPSFSIP